MNHFPQLSCQDFSQALASKTSVPGGGGAAAMVGALSAALCAMVGNFTAGKKKYAAYEADIQRILAEAEDLRQCLLALVDADAMGFEPLAKAYAIPKEDPTRDAVMEQATLGACHAPMQILFACADVMLLLEELLEKGSRLLLADVGCGTYLCKAAMESAALSVFVNTAVLKDRESAAKIELQVDQILKTYLPLAILRLGERPDDISYETGAMKRCAKVGIAVRHFLLSADCTKEELLDNIRRINEDASIHGCLMFRPLPNQAMEEAACALLAPEKDVDCMTAASLVRVFTGKGAGYPPCTAQACMELLDHYQIPLQGKHVAVIGRSLVIGKPVSMMLQARNATVTMCHTRTVDMDQICRNAEILVVAAGKAGVVDSSFAAPGQIVVDVGINVNPEGKLCGDVKFDDVEPIVAAITPVPGGVGSVTTAVLAKHVIEAAEKSVK